MAPWSSNLNAKILFSKFRQPPKYHKVYISEIAIWCGYTWYSADENKEIFIIVAKPAYAPPAADGFRQQKEKNQEECTRQDISLSRQQKADWHLIQKRYLGAVCLQKNRIIFFNGRVLNNHSQLDDSATEKSGAENVDLSNCFFFTATVITCVRYCAVTARVSQPFRCSDPPEIPEHRVAGTGMRLGAGANICSAVFYRRKNSETLSSNHFVFTSCDTRTRGCNGSRINRTSLHYVSAEGFSTAAGAI